MKRLALALAVCGVLAVSVSAQVRRVGFGWVHVVVGSGGNDCLAGACTFQTSFTSAQGWSADVVQQGTGCGGAGFVSIQSGVGNNGNWTSSPVHCDGVNASANMVAGGGGRGFRHYRGDGTDNDSGGIDICLTSACAGVYEVWVRYYQRWSAGFLWGDANPNLANPAPTVCTTTPCQPHFVKDNYFNAGNPVGEFNFGYNGGGWGFRTYEDSRSNVASSLTWTALFGSGAADGKFHCIEYHVKRDTTGGTGPCNGIGEVWVDGTRYLNATDICYGGNSTAPWTDFIISNQDNPINQQTQGNGSIGYTDFDDFGISTTSRVGCTYGNGPLS